MVRACCAAEATVAVAMATDLFREICALAADETPRGAPRPARARLAAALMALAGAAPVREESAARAALRRFRQKRAAARAFAGDVHIRALLDELAGGADDGLGSLVKSPGFAGRAGVRLPRNSKGEARRDGRLH